MFDKFQKVYKKVISQQSLDKFESTFNQPKYKDTGKFISRLASSNTPKENLEKFFNPENVRLWKKYLDLQTFLFENNYEFVLFSNVKFSPKLLNYIKDISKSTEYRNNLQSCKFGNDYVAFNQAGNETYFYENFVNQYMQAPFNYFMTQDEYLAPLLNAQWKAISRQEYQAL